MDSWKQILMIHFVKSFIKLSASLAKPGFTVVKAIAEASEICMQG